MPLARGPFPVVVTTVIAAQFSFVPGLTIFGVGQVSLRQAITPDPLQGRMNATTNFIGASLAPLGGLLGGILGEAIGLRTTLFVAALASSAPTASPHALGSTDALPPLASAPGPSI